MAARLGEILISDGILTSEQVAQLLEHQQNRARPIGLLAERLFGVDPSVIERAWAKQYNHLSPTIDLADPSHMIEPDALRVIERRQAWQFGVLPMRFDGPELVVATTAANLVRALRFLCRSVSVPCQLVVAEAEALGAAIAQHLPLPGMDAATITQGAELPAALRET